jgi:hypothetical protein
MDLLGDEYLTIGATELGRLARDACPGTAPPVPTPAPAPATCANTIAQSDCAVLVLTLCGQMVRVRVLELGC